METINLNCRLNCNQLLWKYMTIKYTTDQKKIGVGQIVQLTGKVIEIAGDRTDEITLMIEVTEFEKIYEKN